MSEIVKFEAKRFDECYYKINHDSGLTVYVCPKERSGAYGVFAVNFGGEVQEYMRKGERVSIPMGCAHFLEHKLFDNEDMPGADEVLSALGAYDNAYTSNEKTAYLVSASENISEALSHLLYFVTHPYFTEQTVQKEVGIIAEEIRGCIDDPYDRCYTNMLSGMYFNNPVKNEICGSEESISHITPEILYNCCRDFYTPENMVFAVCGNIKPEQVLEIVDKEIGTEKKEFDCSLIPFDEPCEVKTPYIEAKMPVGKPILYIGIKDTDISEDHRENYKKSLGMNMLLHIMFSDVGDFYLDMIESELLSPNFESGYTISRRTAYVSFFGESDDPSLVLERIKEYIKSTYKTGISSEELERERKCVYASYLSGFDDIDDIARSLVSKHFSSIDMFDYLNILDSIDLEYINGLLELLVKDECFVLSTVKPE